MEKLASSFARYDQGIILLDQIDPSIEGAKRILLDRSNDELPICRTFKIDETIGNSGTICSIVMDLNKLEMIITKGNPFDNDFEIVKLE